MRRVEPSFWHYLRRFVYATALVLFSTPAWAGLITAGVDDSLRFALIQEYAIHVVKLMLYYKRLEIFDRACLGYSAFRFRGD